MRRHTEQFIFVNGGRLEAIDGAFSESGVGPIITVHGDHGPGPFLRHHRLSNTYLEDRMPTLNTIRLPCSIADMYDGMTLLNSLRVVLKKYFGCNLPRLGVCSYFSERQRPCASTDVTGEIGSAPDERVPRER